MITFDFTQPYPSLTAFLCIGTGVLLLWVDVKGYHARNMPKEKKWAKYLGYLNVFFGIAMFVSGWVYTQWVW